MQRRTIESREHAPVAWFLTLTENMNTNFVNPSAGSVHFPHSSRSLVFEFVKAFLARIQLVTAVLIVGAMLGCVRKHGSRQALARAKQGPTISEIRDQYTVEDVSKTVAFTVGDPDTPLTQLRLSALSSAPVIVPTNSFVFDGVGGERTLTIHPAPGAFGRCSITIKISDGVLETNRSFGFEVSPNNGLPPDFKLK